MVVKVGVQVFNQRVVVIVTKSPLMAVEHGYYGFPLIVSQLAPIIAH